MRAIAIVVAGGSGERFGRAGGKQLVKVLGRPLLSWAVEACARAEGVEHVVVVAPRERVAEYAAVARAAAGDIPIDIAESGATRQSSVTAGLAFAADEDAVIVHDGARPLAGSDLVEATLAALVDDATAVGAIVAHPSVDTIKTVSGHVVAETPARETLWAVQTPQTFRREPLLAAYRDANAAGFLGTDDSSLVERAGGRVLVVEGPRDNLKVTRPEDLALVEAAMRARREDAE